MKHFSKSPIVKHFSRILVLVVILAAIFFMRQPSAASASGSAETFLDTFSVLLNEPFSYPDGPLVGNGGWTAHSGAGNKAIQVNSSEIILDQSSGSGEDVNTPITTMVAGDTYYASFDFYLPSGQTVDPDASGLYFAHFKNSGNVFVSRVFVVDPSGGGDFGIALDASSSTPSVTWPTDLAFDTTYQLVTSYDFDTGESKLWLDPVNEASTNISDATGSVNTAVEAYAFRQSNDYTGSIVIDDLVVGTTFGDIPTSVALNSVGANSTQSMSTLFLATAVLLTMLMVLVLGKSRKTAIQNI